MDLLLTMLSDAAVLAPLAVGLSVIYRMSGVINFAAGTVCIACGYTAVQFANGLLGVVVALVVGTALGVLTYLTTVLPGRLLHAPLIAMTLATVGFSVALEAVGHWVFGGVSTAADPWLPGGFELAGAQIGYQRLLVIAAGVAVVLVVIALFDRTMIGRMMEACAANEPLAQLYGTNPSRHHLLAWALGGFCSAVTGVLQVAVAGISVSLGMHLLLVAAIGAVVGGVQGLRSSALGVLLVAAVSALVARYLTTDYVLVPVFVVLLVALYFRPQGAFAGTKTAERV
ncbi:branched-chain amino acid ABC transporter permease [Pseudonocardia sp. RS010]|uniref:branched-chain amino acid ABC transporter permease n=1 Tax=Pseudonocardia sp. RS010 TaxID=3385979 RepID=UPI0039A0413F